MHVSNEYSDEGKSGKNIQGRPSFQQMMEDIAEKKDGVSFVICFKLSRFGRNTADILNSLKIMRRYGVHLICVKENIDSSLDSGKMMISILGAMAEIERDNIAVQTMAGRREKARQGGWNGGKGPYGYALKDGQLTIIPEEAEHVRIIFDKFVNTNLGTMGVARWLNEHGYVKNITTKNSKDYFNEHFVEIVLKNHTYCGKIAYGKRTLKLKEGTEDEYQRVKVDDVPVYEGGHEAIVSPELWESAQAKMLAKAGRKETIDKEHQYIFSALVKCPKCGKSLYGVPMRRKKRKDGTLYPTYYSYACRSSKALNGIECGYGQISCNIVDKAVVETISSIVNAKNFSEMMSRLIDKQVDSSEAEKELSTAQKAYKQAMGLQKKLEEELDKLDVTDKHYDRKYESLSRRLDEAFDTIEETERKVEECEAKLESIKQETLSRDSVYESLKIFDKMYNDMCDYEKKKFVNSFIHHIELYPDKTRKNGNPVKSVYFRFPVSYKGQTVYEVCPPQKDTDETVVLMNKNFSEAKDHVQIGIDMKGMK
jgi:site-specific DNA recombinase